MQNAIEHFHESVMYYAERLKDLLKGGKVWAPLMPSVNVVRSNNLPCRLNKEVGDAAGNGYSIPHELHHSTRAVCNCTKKGVKKRGQLFA